MAQRGNIPYYKHRTPDVRTSVPQRDVLLPEGYHSNTNPVQTIFGEITSYDPLHNPWKDPIAILHLIMTFWFAAYLIVFLIVVFGNYFVNNWVALLVYMIGTGLIVVLLQLLFVILDLSNSSNLAYAHQTAGDFSTTGPNAIHYRNYKGLAYHKEIGLAVLTTMIAGLCTCGLWYSWLNVYKGASSYTSDRTITDVNMAADTPDHLRELHSFQNINIIFVLLHILALLYLIRAVWAHFRPLRSLTHLVTGQPLYEHQLVGSDARPVQYYDQFREQ